MKIQRFHLMLRTHQLLQNSCRKMLILRHKDKLNYCVLILLSVWSPSEVHCVGHLRHENKISTSTDHWAVGVVVSRSQLEQSVRNVTEAGQGFTSKLEELKEEYDEEMRVLGQGRAFDSLIHTKEIFLNLAESCVEDFQDVLQTIDETFDQLFSKFTKRALSPDTWAGLGIGSAQFLGSMFDFMREYERNREIRNLNREVNQRVGGVEQKTKKISEEFHHFADQSVSVYTKLFDQIKQLNAKMNNFVKEIFETIDIGNRYKFLFYKCENVLSSAKKLMHHLELLLEGVLQHKQKLPSKILLKYQAEKEITEKFHEKTQKEPFFAPRESDEIIQFAEFGVVRNEEWFILYGNYRIPTKISTDDLYSYTSEVEYIPEDDLFCKIEDEQGIIMRDHDTFGEISKEKLNRCQHSKKIIVCDGDIAFHSIGNETCASALLSNSSRSQITKKCNLECRIGDRPVVVPRNNGTFAITVKSKTPYLLICGSHWDELELEIGHTDLHVKQGCSVKMDYFSLSAGGVQYQGQSYKELSLKIPNLSLNDIHESKKEAQEESTEVVVDDLDVELIEKNIQNIKIPGVINESGEIYQYRNEFETYMLIAICGLVAAAVIIFLLMVVICVLCSRGRGRCTNEDV